MLHLFWSGRNNFKLGRNDFELGRNDSELGETTQSWGETSVIRLGNSHLRWQSQNINWKFLVISRTTSLLVCDTKSDTFCRFCKARTAFSKRILKFSIIAISFVGRCCSYSLNNSSKPVRNKFHWLCDPIYTILISLCYERHDHKSLGTAMLLSDKCSSRQTLPVETLTGY